MKYIGFLFLVFLVSHFGNASLAAQVPDLSSVATSHIDGNVPEAKDFDVFLKRDLLSYFKERGRIDIEVKYELLRIGPTQTGISYPKFYAWVKIMGPKGLVEEGAVRLAAVDKVRFDVTHYLARNILIGSPESIDQLFPKEVGDRIRKIVGITM